MSTNAIIIETAKDCYVIMIRALNDLDLDFGITAYPPSISLNNPSISIAPSWEGRVSLLIRLNGGSLPTYAIGRFTALPYVAY